MNQSGNVDSNVLHRMRDSMTYGGPDASGLYVDQTNTLGLGHRRLAVIDLSPEANQPFSYKHFHLVYNGEIYNYQDVRAELVQSGHSFRTNSDTEVILHAWEQWGMASLEKFRGMFAMALWDEQEERLTLCRDRVGVKPLYWYKKNDLFMFASELKAFHQHPAFDKTINQASIPGFLKHGYIQHPMTIYQYAHKLEPGSVMTVSGSGAFEIKKYWSLKQIYNTVNLTTKSDTVLIEECESILTESFMLRMVADVPVGVFLSGGIDSSLVAALIQRNSPSSLKTYTIGFNEKEYNEAEHAKRIAEHLGTDHHEVYCGEDEFSEILRDYFNIYDEPFGDNSGIPTFLVSKLARKDVTVSLSADGGDEIFAGYLKYSANHLYFKRLSKIPGWTRDIMAGTIEAIGHDRAIQLLNRLPLTSGIGNLEWRLTKIVNAIKARNPVEFQNLISSYMSDKRIAELIYNPIIEQNNQGDWKQRNHMVYGLLGAMDITTYLEGDILTKVDRATMQNALEAREPFLDQHIIEFAMSLPDNLKIREGETKWILRQILYKYVPKELLDRPKQGFAIPTKKWLHTILSQELDGIYLDTDFVAAFHFQPDTLKQIIVNFKTNAKRQENPYLVWFLYCLYGWYRKWC